MSNEMEVDAQLGRELRASLAKMLDTGRSNSEIVKKVAALIDERASHAPYRGPDFIPLPGEVWRHNKTKTRYRVEALCRGEGSGLTLVVYQAVTGGPMWGRELSVWLEHVSGLVAGKPDEYIPRFTRED